MDSPITWTLNTDSARIALPCFGEEIAPLFDAARKFRIWNVSSEGVEECREALLEGDNGVARLRLMRELGVTVVIANGIRQSLRRLLETAGIEVVHGVSGMAVDVLFGWLAGRLKGMGSENPEVPVTGVVAADMVEWTQELLIGLGWTVDPVTGADLSPVDLIAEHACPVCGKPVRVAVCCGAHAWRVDEEIGEFHRLTSSGYHGRLYVHPPLPAAMQYCAAYGIELLDPSAFHAERPSEGQLPPLHSRITGHPNLNTTVKHGPE